MDVLEHGARRRSHRRAIWTWLLATALAACGGSTSDVIGPFWVPTQVAVIDLDRDGLADILTLATWTESYEHRNGHLKLQRQAAPGVFAVPIDQSLAGYPWKWALADLDGDGLLDAVITHPDARQISLLLQDAAAPGHWQAEQRIDVGARVEEAALGDFDGDARPDIALTDALGTDLLILAQLSGQPGRFAAPRRLPIGLAAGHLASADLDGDGRADLLLSGGGTVQLLLQREGGSFAAPLQVGATSGGRVVRFVAAADFNRDGRLDVFFAEGANEPGDVAATRVSTALQSAVTAGSFEPATEAVTAASGYLGYALGDLDADGRPDAAMGRFYPFEGQVFSDVAVLRQAGGAGITFGSEVISMPGSVEPVAIGNTDGDGLNDIVAFGSQDRVYLLHQHADARGRFEAPVRLR